jgi:hypothetical protein
MIRATFVTGEDLAGSAVAVVVVWGLVGLAIAVRRFRWEPREGVTGA